MHVMFMKNFKKYYQDEIYISEECDNFKGVPEDEYFIDLIYKIVMKGDDPTKLEKFLMEKE